MNWNALKTEVDTDPLGRGYASMTHAQVAESLNDPTELIPRQSLSGDEVFQATDPTEFAALLPNRQELWLSFCARESIDPWASANASFVQWLFGPAATTLANLIAMRRQDGSRAQSLGLGRVQAKDVAKVRSV